MARHRLFSKRNRTRPGNLISDVTEEFKRRLIHSLDVFVENRQGMVDQLLAELSQLLRTEYGGLNSPAYRAISVSEIPVIDHLFFSDRDQSLDFIEAIFLLRSFTQGQKAVDFVNELFDDCHLAYRLSDYVEHKIPDEKRHFRVEIEYPTVIPVSDEATYEHAIKPALAVLGDGSYSVANRELLDAFSCCKMGNFDESITKSCAAYESYLKTVCQQYGINHDPNRDTCSRLVKHLIGAELLPSWYTPCLESVGTIRNKVGSAHGRGPNSPESATRHYAEHIFNIVCAHILLIEGAKK
jgi:hypothetical protein